MSCVAVVGSVNADTSLHVERIPSVDDRDSLRGAMERARAESAKCVLLCANCHAEVEHGHRTLRAGAVEKAPRGGFEPPRTD